MNTPARRLDPIAERAIDWLVRLDSGSATAEERSAFEAWLDADPRHNNTWQAISGLLHPPIAALREDDHRDDAVGGVQFGQAGAAPRGFRAAAP
ncbi:FecR/PupR family sigma factor regulator [Thauera linaloolentis]|uniref:FecR family anti-sigma factor protein n=1 Tax=Thauera linaloolentis (strain DSM 12138 / JCM 21573 / CCUG 41526 / CIP 105981 / IAM 15112 / NBRC 102519 / 47Lol) TaxID=1123367 RepID=N6YEZ8_THAL4|nr:DUF4880 domain-containing protein [Thauera linaloolentis]ENO90105.1 FecR family anti-sigma factor protein [Thauera linaloolentis 47Lol = DSM 12138]MCM8565389.1 DUF4880 domain-containing protein [Thauera linaloolentis]